MRGLLIVAALGACSALTGQIAWSPIPVLANSNWFAVYDSWRDRVVAIDGAATREFDGSSWHTVATTTTPYLSLWMEFDRARGRTVICGSTTGTAPEMWEWDGSSWQYAGLNSCLVEGMTLFHPGLGKVLVCSQSSTQGLELWTWDGQSFVHLPMPVAPPTRPQFGSNTYSYYLWTYDERIDRVVLFGRAEQGPVGLVAREPITWEWDPANGWVNLGSSGTLTGSPLVWFDRHRGQVLRYDIAGSVPSAYVRTAAGTWSSFPAPPPLWLYSNQCYDSLRNRLYTYNSHAGNPGPGYLASVSPAVHTGHAVGCASLASPTLELTAPWTRAWIGRLLSVDISNLSSPVAVFAMGFHDQSYQSTTLPLSLASLGMPSCFLNVAPEATLLLPASAGVATATIPIPNVASLVGVRYFQQAFAPVLGANALGMLASPSQTGTAGKSH